MEQLACLIRLCNTLGRLGVASIVLILLKNPLLNRGLRSSTWLIGRPGNRTETALHGSTPALLKLLGGAPVFPFKPGGFSAESTFLHLLLNCGYLLTQFRSSFHRPAEPGQPLGQGPHTPFPRPAAQAQPTTASAATVVEGKRADFPHAPRSHAPRSTSPRPPSSLNYLESLFSPRRGCPGPCSRCLSRVTSK
jgi:hypothetical protein